MMFNKDESQILKRLASDQNAEMMTDELEDILNAELDKPDTEIDGQLVDEILRVLEPAEPSKAQMEKSWPSVLNALPSRREARRRARRLRYAAVLLVGAVIGTAIMARDADALKLTFLKKIIEPFQETYSLIIDSFAPERQQEEAEPSAYYAEDVPSTQVDYAGLEDVPEMHGVYAVRPRWLPEGYEFAAGSYFYGADTHIYAMDFFRGEEWMGYTVQIFDPGESIFSYDFEQTRETSAQMQIGQYDVTIYSNAHDEIQSASWVCENANYVLTGQFTREDLVQFVEHLN